MAQFKWKMAQFKLYLADAIFSTEINEKWHNLNEKWHSPELSQNQWGRAIHCKHCAPWSTLFCYGLSCVPRTNTPYILHSKPRKRWHDLLLGKKCSQRRELWPSLLGLLEESMSLLLTPLKKKGEWSPSTMWILQSTVFCKSQQFQNMPNFIDSAPFVE